MVLRACTRSGSFSLLSLRVVLEYSDFSAQTLGLQYSISSSVNFGNYEFVASYAELFPPCLLSFSGFRRSLTKWVSSWVLHFTRT